MSHQADFIQGIYAQEREVETDLFRCDSCESCERSGYHDQSENFYFCDDCVLRGNHMEHYRYGTLEEWQIAEIHKEFKKI